MNVTIYSANFGNYDPDPYSVLHLQRPNVKYKWLTQVGEADRLWDRKDDGWLVVEVAPDNALSPDTPTRFIDAKKNRICKLQPHRFGILNDSDINVYIDSNKQLFDIDKLLEYCERLYNDPDTDAYFYNHEHRTTVRQELKEIIDWRRDDPARVKKQFTEYWKEGFRDDISLCVASVQIRKTHAPELQKFLDCWWNEVKHKSYRDQISWPYAIWKTGFNRFKRLDVKNERFNMIANIEHLKVVRT